MVDINGQDLMCWSDPQGLTAKGRPFVLPGFFGSLQAKGSSTDLAVKWRLRVDHIGPWGFL